MPPEWRGSLGRRGNPYECEALARAIVDDGENAQAATIHHLIGKDVGRPALIGCAGTSIGARVPVMLKKLSNRPLNGPWGQRPPT